MWTFSKTSPKATRIGASLFFEITWGFGVLYWISRFYVMLRNALCVDAFLEPKLCDYHVAGKG